MGNGTLDGAWGWFRRRPWMAAGLLAAACVVIAMSASAWGTSPGSSPRPRANWPLERVHAGGRRPNILLLVTDDQDKSSMAVMRHTKRYFEHGGTTFANGRVTTPLCCPARASMFSGLYAHNHHIWTNNPKRQFGHSYRPTETFPSQLQRAGYRTALIGKYLNNWHRGKDGYGGFDVFKNNYAGTEKDKNRRGESDDIVTRRAIRFIDSTEKNDQRPWMATVSFRSPHVPLVPADRYLHADVPNLPHFPSFAENDRKDKPPYLRQKRHAKSYPKMNERFKLYERTLLSADDGVRRIIKKLRKRGENRNTLAIFISDNGYLFGQHDLLGKVTPYRESTNVPFMARWPGTIPAGRRDQRLVANIDLAPTFYDVAGIDPPYRPDGRSLFSKRADRRYLLTEAIRWRAIQDRRGVLIQTKDPVASKTVTEFYNWSRDPDEVRGNPRLRTPAERARFKAMKKALKRAKGCAGATCP